jgi:hypothetical protein
MQIVGSLAVSQIPATGLIQFGTERPGIYIENADAIVLTADLRKLLGPDPSESRREAVRWFVELLERVK